jgi:hypothetical protein
LACCIHGRAEAVATFHRKFREGVIGSSELTTLLRQFEQEGDQHQHPGMLSQEMIVVGDGKPGNQLGRHHPSRRVKN